MGGCAVIDKNEMLRLYNEGKTDREIADTLSEEINVVTGWRRNHHLPVNLSKRTLERQQHQITYERLYRQGYDDYSLARAVGVVNAAVRRWRKRRGLPEAAR